MKELFLIDGTILKCCNGSAPSDLKVTSQNFARMNDKLQATEEDKKQNENILPFGICTVTQKPCIPNVLQWDNKVAWNRINEMATITTKSTMQCSLGGLIKYKEVGQNGHGIGGGTKDDRKSIEEIHFEIEKVEFLTQNNQSLIPENDSDFNALVSPVFYGEKVKIRITTKNAQNNENIRFCLQGSSKGDNQAFEEIGSLQWNLKLINNQCETEPFYLKQSWYSEDLEYYNYKEHITEVSAYNQFYIAGEFNSENFVLPKKEQQLTPKAYKRNYEELIGLFKTDNSGKKDLEKNYENHFIKNSNLERLVDFCVFSLDVEGASESFEKSSINFIAQNLWRDAVESVQNGKLDDRPLYWARNKVEVAIKRLPLFKNDINYKTSQVKPNSQLAQIIQLFEEESRNYTNIDFSKAAGRKKILITGFDPFLLNSIDHKYKDQFNILQSNPSGVVALALNNNTDLGAYIQTMLIPVRYSDFDGSQKNNEGQGEGIIEKYLRPFINEVDMIITVSQAGENDYHIDLFATATREGFNDNQNFIRIDGSTSLNNAPETIKTTLPITFTEGSSKAIYWGEYNDTKYNYNSDIKLYATLNNYPNYKIYNGPSGNYLSNEIFYRVAKLREEIRPTLKTGHFHIARIQLVGDLDFKEVEKLLFNVKQVLLQGFKCL